MNLAIFITCPVTSVQWQIATSCIAVGWPIGDDATAASHAKVVATSCAVAMVGWCYLSPLLAGDSVLGCLLCCLSFSPAAMLQQQLLVDFAIQFCDAIIWMMKPKKLSIWSLWILLSYSHLFFAWSMKFKVTFSNWEKYFKHYWHKQEIIDQHGLKFRWEDIIWIITGKLISWTFQICMNHSLKSQNNVSNVVFGCTKTK